MNRCTKPLMLSAEAIEERLDEHVDAVLSSRRTAAEPARMLAELGAEHQEFVLQWVAAIAQTNAEMAYQFAVHAGKALRQMDREGVEAWVIQAMDAYDNKGLSAGIAQLSKVREFVTQRQERATGLSLEEISGVLENYIQGLNGRSLNLDVSDEVFTDTETLFLPGLINRFATRDENFRLYKTMAVHQWAQTWFGTWRLDLAQLSENLPQKEKSIRLFHALETLRLDACIDRELPGVYRDMQTLRRRLDRQALPANWAGINERLQSKDAQALDSWALVVELLDGPVPPPCCYQGLALPSTGAGDLRGAQKERKKGPAHRPGQVK